MIFHNLECKKIDFALYFNKESIMLHLTLGCMFSGKTTKLIETAAIGQCLVLDYDTTNASRPYSSDIYSHDARSISCIKVNDLSKIDITIFDSILINEAQFFTGLKKFIMDALEDGKHVHVFGLDGDFKQEVFGEMIELIPIADSYVKLYARCLCGNKAAFSKRNTKNVQQYAPHDSYRPACRKCLTYDA